MIGSPACSRTPQRGAELHGREARDDLGMKSRTLGAMERCLQQPAGARLSVCHPGPPPEHAASRLEQMAADAALVSGPRLALLGLLLDATLPAASFGCAALRPLWANEAMQRAQNMIRLVVALDRREPAIHAEPARLQMECRIAAELAAAYRQLDLAEETGVLPCSPVLRTAVRDLVDLFGSSDGQARPRTSIERLALPSYKCRALVLAACALVIDVLGRISTGHMRGCVAVSLRQIGPAQARLSVVDDGWNLLQANREPPDEVLSDLAALLECDPAYRVLDSGGFVAELTFPI